jgi:hypothetical protein
VKNNKVKVNNVKDSKLKYNDVKDINVKDSKLKYNDVKDINVKDSKLKVNDDLLMSRHVTSRRHVRSLIVISYGVVEHLFLILGCAMNR